MTNIIPFRQTNLMNPYYLKPAVIFATSPKVFEVPTEPEPKPEPKKEPVEIEAMPWEALPEGYTDYRPLLQRDGLILMGWEFHGKNIVAVWCTANGKMRKYQSTLDEADISAICPRKGYENWRHWYHQCKTPDQVINAAPPDLTPSMRPAFLARLRESGVSVDFDYRFTLGRQKAEREAALLSRIENPNSTLSFEESELLEVYRQLDRENKTALIEYMKTLQAEQENYPLILR